MFNNFYLLYDVHNNQGDTRMFVQNQEKEMKQQQIQPKISTIFKEKVVDIPQAFGSFVSDDGEKYCAVSALLKYLGHDISITTKIQNNTDLELIPSDILETLENFV